MSDDQRLPTLKTIMLRRDLSAAELRICWYLLTQVMNTTANCCCSNQHLANALSLDLATIKRAKATLRSKQILTWPKLGKLGASAHLASTYTFTTRKEGASTRLASGAPTRLDLGASTRPRVGASTRLDQSQNKQPHDAAKAAPTHHASDQSIYFGKVAVRDDTPQRTSWDQFLIQHTGRPAPRSRTGRWGFRSEYPSETVQ